jgi:hypothetical protein
MQWLCERRSRDGIPEACGAVRGKRDDRGGCPSHWKEVLFECVKNSLALFVPNVPAKDLGKLALGAAVRAGENDSLMLSYGGEIYELDAPDSVLDISSVWTQVEFNVLGNAGGSRADFNKGSSITVDLLLDGGRTPKCLIPKPTTNGTGGTALESNNLTLGACNIITGGVIPTVQFTESN